MSGMPPITLQNTSRGRQRARYLYHLTTTSEDELSATYQKFEDILSGVGLRPGQKAVLYEDGLTTRFGSSCRGWWLLNHLGHDNTAILTRAWPVGRQRAWPPITTRLR